jgi:aminopeptidase N
MSRCLLVAVALLLAGSSHAAAPRLAGSVRPVRYALTIEPDLHAGTFAGREEIDLELKEPARAITLHAVELAIGRTEVEAGGKRQTARVTADAATQTVTLAFDEPLGPGPARLLVEWRGKLSHSLRGLYAAESGGRRYAFTQLEPTDARRMFPCFDEPAQKARFTLTAVIDATHLAVSNAPVAEERVDPKTHKKTVRFAETAPMSSYLLALAVGPLEERRAMAGTVPIRIITTPGRSKLGAYALGEAAALLGKLGDYFGVAYPYGKLDLVAVPDFEAGAMENTGAIFFRESRLLLDERASAGQRRTVSIILAHEMAHQWFGDLVTMAWWDDLWLNEAFASWMEYKVIDALHPDWQVWVDFAAQKTATLALDALGSTHAIRVPIETPEQANEAFDAITYDKGAAVLRMLEMYLGESTFRDGVRAYVRAHANGNARAAGLTRR